MNTAKFAALAIALTAATAQAQLTRQDARKLAEIAKTPHDSVAVAALQAKAPKDARLPYLTALSRVERRDYRGALEQVKRSLKLDPSNLDAWKVRIWLAMATKDFSDAANSMDWLAQRMPAQAATPAAEQTCVEFAHFMGECFGYLAGPQGDRAAVAPVAKRALSRLAGNREAAFVTAHSRVVNEFNDRMDRWRLPATSPSRMKPSPVTRSCSGWQRKTATPIASWRRSKTLACKDANWPPTSEM